MNTTSIGTNVTGNQTLVGSSINALSAAAYAAALRDQLLALYLCIPLTLLALVPNLLVVLTIALSKVLHNKGHYVILSHAVAECIYLIVSIPIGVKQYLSLIGYLAPPSSITFLECAFGRMMTALGGTASFYLSVWLAIDRLIGIVFPIFYRTASIAKHVAFVNVLTWTCAVFTYTLGLIGMDTTQVFPLCQDTTPIYNDGAQIWYANGNLILTPVMAFCYVLSSMLLYYRFKKANLIGETQRSEWKKLVRLNEFIALASIGFVFVTTVVMRSVCRTVAFSLATLGHNDGSTFLRLMAYSAGYVEKMSHFFLHIRFNTDFRKSFLKIFRRKKKHTAKVVVLSIAEPSKS